jgi:hypothetical protein
MPPPRTSTAATAVLASGIVLSIVLCCTGMALIGVGVDDDPAAPPHQPMTVSLFVLSASGLVLAMAIVGAATLRRRYQGWSDPPIKAVVGATAVLAFSLCCSGFVSGGEVGSSGEPEPLTAIGLVLVVASLVVVLVGITAVVLLRRRARTAVGQPASPGRPRWGVWTLLSPRALSRFLFFPADRYRVADSLISTLGTIRTIVALGIYALLIGYDGDSVTLIVGQAARQTLNLLTVGTGAVLCAGIIAVALATRSGRHRLVGSALLRPTGTVAYAWLLLGVVLLDLYYVLTPAGELLSAGIDRMPDYESLEPTRLFVLRAPLLDDRFRVVLVLLRCALPVPPCRGTPDAPAAADPRAPHAPVRRLPDRTRPVAADPWALTRQVRLSGLWHRQPAAERIGRWWRTCRRGSRRMGDPPATARWPVSCIQLVALTMGARSEAEGHTLRSPEQLDPGEIPEASP